jgi:hypothetical protein
MMLVVEKLQLIIYDSWTTPYGYWTSPMVQDLGLVITDQNGTQYITERQIKNGMGLISSVTGSNATAQYSQACRNLMM